MLCRTDKKKIPFLKLVPPTLQTSVWLSKRNQLVMERRSCKWSQQHLILTRDCTTFEQRTTSTESTAPATGPQRPTCCVIWGRIRRSVTVDSYVYTNAKHILYLLEMYAQYVKRYRAVGPVSVNNEVTQLTVQKLSAFLGLRERKREKESKFHTFSPCFAVGSHEEWVERQAITGTWNSG